MDFKFPNPAEGWNIILKIKGLSGGVYLEIYKPSEFSDLDPTILAATRVLCGPSDEPKSKISKDIDIEESPKMVQLDYSTIRFNLILQGGGKGGGGEPPS